MFKVNNSMLTEPHKLTWPYGWCGHIPFVSWLIEEQQPSVIVELGTHSGNSYLAMCQAVAENCIDAKCYAVDTWKGDEHAGNYAENVYTELAKYHNEHYAEFSNLMRMTFDEANSYFNENSIDLLHIDGFHTYEAVKHDFLNWLPKISDNGIILFHDINVRERNFGVWKFWEELRLQYPHYEFKHSHGLGVLFIGSMSQAILNEKLKTDISGYDEAVITKLFARLGELICSRVDIKSDNYSSQEKLNDKVMPSNNDIKNLIENTKNHIIEKQNYFEKIITEFLIFNTEKNENFQLQLNSQQQILNKIIERHSLFNLKSLNYLLSKFKKKKKEFIKLLKKSLRNKLRKIYYKFPKKWQPALLNWAIKVHPSWFKNHPKVLSLKKNICYNNYILLDIESQNSNLKGQAGSVAVHCHIFYKDLINEFVEQLSNVPFKFDVFVSVTDKDTENLCKKRFEKIKKINILDIQIVPNKGRDIAPMFVVFGSKLKQYEYIAHLQSKKSKYNNGATDGWRSYLFNSLFGNSSNIQKIFSLFLGNKKIGIIYPQMYHRLPYFACTWLANRTQGHQILNRLKLPMVEGYFNFPVGSMFWARTDALKPLFNLNFKWEDFPEERGQTDGTLAHVLERLLGVVPAQTGYNSIVLKERENPSWSTYRFDTQYFNRNIDFYKSKINQEKIKIVAFDIFDTLLIRPLLNPDHTKRIVALSLDNESKIAFEKYRGIAESESRIKKGGKDVSINDIYDQFQQLSKLPESKVHYIQKIEENVEISSVSARQEIVQILNYAKNIGKKVILISDMFLTKDIIETMLFQNGIDTWDNLYLSSDIGKRKDSGELYEYVLKKESIDSNAMIMIGDNERSDLQLPTEKYGIKCLHILRASDLAFALPSYSNLMSKGLIKNDINKELTIGLLVKKNLNNIFLTKNKSEFLSLFNSNPYQLGYNLVGPVVTAFCQWLIEQAKVDKINTLYFLAREGKFIKQVYDLWSITENNSPKSIYLQLSRRCVTVPDITNMEDIIAIAEKNYFENDIQNYFIERFGLKLDPERWEEIYQKKLWIKNEKLSIKQKNIIHLKPLLDFLKEDIINEAKIEKQTLMMYLEQVNINSNQTSSVVDVGYSGTIQKALNKLLMKPIHGYYFATMVSHIEGLENNIMIKGCYVDNCKSKFHDSKLFSHSFELEKLLSADDPQIIKYIIDENINLKGKFKDLSEEELATRSIRAQLQQGAIDFVHDSVDIRKNMYNDFNPSLLIADILYKEFCFTLQTKSNKVLEELILDDDYCGRGLVS